MAEIKKEAPKDELHWAIAFLPLLIIAALVFVGARMGGENILGERTAETENNSLATKTNIFSPYEWIGSGELYEGVVIINTDNTTVRTAPAGGIVGTQKKLKTGIIRGEPIQSFNTTWWRVNYEEAPDGWVSSEHISSKVRTIQALNIVPIFYAVYKPIGYTFLFILLIAYIFFRLRLKKEEKIAEKKKQLKDELYQEKPVPISVRIEQKPDVQEIPGFQTEEIVPVQILEQQNRWKHIQELIKSYNANDWRQAIIEADIILEEMLDKMQYEGVTIGDKLKKVEKSDFVTLDRAWSAHRVRNQIAHDGSSFKLHRELAEKTIKDYEEVFREFYYI